RCGDQPLHSSGGPHPPPASSTNPVRAAPRPRPLLTVVNLPDRGDQATHASRAVRPHSSWTNESLLPTGICHLAPRHVVRLGRWPYHDARPCPLAAAGAGRKGATSLTTEPYSL